MVLSRTPSREPRSITSTLNCSTSVFRCVVRSDRQNISAVRTAWPATGPAHSFFKFRAYPLNVLPSGFRFLDGEYPADPLIACEWANVLPLFPRHRIRNQNFPQICGNTVYGARGDCFLAHEFHSTSAVPRPALQVKRVLFQWHPCAMIDIEGGSGV